LGPRSSSPTVNTPRRSRTTKTCGDEDRDLANCFVITSESNESREQGGLLRKPPVRICPLVAHRRQPALMPPAAGAQHLLVSARYSTATNRAGGASRGQKHKERSQ
jgi:hypothetical protein